MSEDGAPQPQQRQFRGRDLVLASIRPRPIAPTSADAPASAGAAATCAAPTPVDPAGLPVAPGTSRPSTERERLFERYAELRVKIAEEPSNEALLESAAQTAEELSLTIEAIELWRDCLRYNPAHLAATQRLAALDRRAAATGETGGARAPVRRTREQPPESPAFWTHLGSVASFPFRGRGLGVFVGASLFFAVGEIIATFNVFFGWFVMLCLLGYLAAWQFDVISRTAAGRDDPPEFPEVISVIESCVLPFLGFLGCCLFAFAPVLILGGLVIQGSVPIGVGFIGMAVLFVPCGFVFPMTLTVRALTQSVGESMNPARVYGSIARVLPDYILAFLALAALWCAWAVVRVCLLMAIGLVFGLPTADAVLRLDYVRIAGWLLYTAAVWPLLLYVWCVQGHVLGCLYRQSYKRLAWFVTAGTETAAAKRLSGAVALAGLGGIVLLSGGAWLTLALWPGDRANAILAGGGPCPIAAGGELTYYWENTDGPSGTVTYAFDGAIEGRLGIHGFYRQGGEWGVTASDSPAALIDASNGNVIRGNGEQAGINLAEKTGMHTRFYGPKRGSTNSTYLNDWSVRGETRFKDTWKTWRVVDPDSGTELYYDKATGILVGRKFAGVGFSILEWLTAAKGVPGIGACPGPSRTFDDIAAPPADSFGDEFFPPPPGPGPRRR